MRGSTLPRQKLSILLVVCALVFSIISQGKDTATYSDDSGRSFGQPIIDHYPAHVYGAYENNWSMIIGDNGWLYAGNGHGVLEYDGHEWRLIKTPNLGVVRSLQKDKNGVIYVGALNSFGYLKKDQFGQLQYQELSDSSDVPDKNFDEVSNVFVFEGAVYYVTNKWLFRLNILSNNKDQRITAWPYLENSPIRDVFQYDSKLYFSAKDFNFEINQSDQLVKVDYFSDQDQQLIRVIETLQTDHKELVFSGDDVYLKADEFGFEDWNTPAGHELKNSWIYDVMPYNSGYFVVATVKKGVVFVAYDGQDVFSISKEQGLPNEIAVGITVDKQDGLWVGSLGRGLSRIQSPLTVRVDKKNVGLKKIRSMINYKNHSVGLTFTGLAILKNGAFTHHEFERAQLQSIIDSQVNGLLVAGYFGIALVDIDFETSLNKITSTIIKEGLVVEEMIQSSWHDDEFFIRLKNGLARLLYKDEQWFYEEVEIFKDDVTSLAFNQQHLWLSLSTGELLKVEKFNALKDYTKTSFYIENHTPLYKTRLFSSQNGLIATHNNEIFHFDEASNQFSLLSTLNGESEIELLKQDQSGRFWLSTKTKLLSFDDEFKQVDRTLTQYLEPGLTTSLFFDELTDRKYLLQTSGIVAITGDIYPAAVVTPQIKSIQNGNDMLPMNKSIEVPTHDIQFNISYPDFSKTKTAKYKTCLSGESCTNWSNNTQVNFSNIPGGTYDLSVLAGDSNKQVGQNTFQFKVADYWYQTVWFKLLALLASALLVFLISKISTYQIKKRNQQLQQLVTKRTAKIKQQSDELHQLDQARIRFFANVSHEFRTPLTLAIAPLESLLHDNPQLEKHLSHPIQTSIVNSKKMLSLVGQILDINRLESGRFPLRVASYDVADLMNQMALRFRVWAQKNNQTIVVENTQEPVMLFCDLAQVDKCISNLISNAIKYSGQNSTITLSLLKIEQRIGLKVSDTGQGISEQSLEKVFDRFYQDQQSETISDAGTGIGLSLVKELTELHHGTVELINQVGQGCEFVLWFKRGKDHFDATMLHEPINLDAIDPIKAHELPERLVDENVNSKEDITTVLVVDDNVELCDFVASRLSTYYRVIQKHNGEDGLLVAKLELPDLIISDVMMPKMNGLEMSQQLKNDQTTNTIPIILLTAKSSKREVVEGLQTGADDYLSKPFDTSELIMRVAGLINNRKLIRQSIQLEVSQKFVPKSGDDFTAQLTQAISKQLSNPQLNVESLAEALNVSSSTLFRKCEKELNKSPAKIIREVRMSHAMNLLMSSQLSVSEIAYGIGFESLSYFSRTFKQYYEKSPSSVRAV